MTKTEAAEIIVNHASVVARKYGWTGAMSSLRIGVVLSEMLHQSEPGCLLHQAAVVRPSDKFIIQTARRMHA